LNFGDGSMISMPNVAGLFSGELFKYHFTLQNKPATLGIEIIDPSPKFKEFIRTLDIVNVN